MHGHKTGSDELQIGQSGGGKIDPAADGHTKNIHKKRGREQGWENGLVSHREKAVNLSFG